jgi:putative membrane protein
VLPKARIQTADLTDTPLSRGFGISALRFGVAGGGFGGHLIPAIPTDTARQLRSELLGSAS